MPLPQYIQFFGSRGIPMPLRAGIGMPALQRDENLDLLSIGMPAYRGMKIWIY
jgi:hypothetical protein